MQRQTQNQLQRSSRLTFLIGISTALLLVTPILVLLIAGFFADTFFRTTPLFTIGGVLIGFIGGMMNIFRLLQATQKWKK